MSKRPKRKAVENTEIKAKKARGETDLGNNLLWKDAGECSSKGTFPLITLTSDTLPGSEKIAAFDIDWTVIQTSSGRKFATGSNDWEFWHESVPDKMKQLHDDGFRVVFFTNQAGIEKGKVTPQIFRDKTEAIIKDLGIPVLVFAATGTDHYRKPATSMWEHFLKHSNQDIEVDKSQSFYVGDAAGRAKNWAPGKPKDFSSSDRMFANNIGLKFQTPEEFFLNEKAVKFEWGSIDPNELLKKNPPITDNDEEPSYFEKGTEMVIMVGQPASGKSTFRNRYLEPHGYVAVNRDTLGTAEKCMKVAKETLKSGKSVVVDNTNPSASARAPFIKIAKDAGVPCRCFWLQTPLELSHHLNLYRMNQTLGKVRRVPDVGYNVYKKNFEEPTVSEGFSKVTKIPFKPKFDNDKDKALFRQWTV